MIQTRLKPLEQSLWVLTCQSEIQADVGEWLSQIQWQSTSDLKELRQSLLRQASGTVLLDIRNSPNKILSDARYIKEHFSNCAMVALVDPHNKHWIKEAMRHGVDVCVSLDDISSEGLYMLIESLQTKLVASPLTSIPRDLPTGLINGPLFFDRLNHALKVAERHQCRTGILLVNIDDYEVQLSKQDTVTVEGFLSVVAARLKTTLRNSDSLARIHDSLFAILLEDLQDEVMVAHIAKNIQQQFDQVFNIHEQPIQVSASIGGHLCEAGELNGGVLYQQTEEALERAMASGKQGMWFYIQDMNFKAMARLNMLHGLERALNKNEFQLQYQPIHTGKGFIPCGVTPEVYWHHPTAGMVASEIFMDLLIDSGLIIEAGEWMIKTLCEQVKTWRMKKNWHSRLQVFLPISEKQLRDNRLQEILITEIRLNDIGTEKIIIKLSEQAANKNIKIVNDLLQAIPNIGLAVELKSSSGGYNTFSYLKEMNVDYICLDKEFFQHMHVDHLETSMATVIVNLAHSQGIQIMANGADSEYKVEKMQALGCNNLQGKYFSPAIHADQWADYLIDH